MSDAVTEARRVVDQRCAVVEVERLPGAHQLTTERARLAERELKQRLSTPSMP